jgi:hypothetical protein
VLTLEEITVRGLGYRRQEMTKFHFCVYGTINAGDDVEAMSYLDAILSEDEGTISSPQILVKEDDS